MDVENLRYGEKGLGIKTKIVCFLTKIKIQKTFMPPNVPPEWFLYSLLGQMFFPLVFTSIDLHSVRHSVQTATRAMFEAGGLGKNE
jgi:hypothetical protein